MTPCPHEVIAHSMTSGRIEDLTLIFFIQQSRCVVLCQCGSHVADDLLLGGRGNNHAPTAACQEFQSEFASLRIPTPSKPQPPSSSQRGGSYSRPIGRATIGRLGRAQEVAHDISLRCRTPDLVANDFDQRRLCAACNRRVISIQHSECMSHGDDDRQASQR